MGQETEPIEKYRENYSSPVIFDRNSTGSVSSLNSGQSRISSRVNSKESVTHNISDLFLKINKEKSVTQSETNVTENLANFLRWSTEQKRKKSKKLE
jgi:hypothetical protein